MSGNYGATVRPVAPRFDKSLPIGRFLIRGQQSSAKEPQAPAQKNTRSSEAGCVSARNAHCTCAAVSSIEGGCDIDSSEGVFVKSRSGWCGVVARRYFGSTRVAASIGLAMCFAATPVRGQMSAPAEAPRVIAPTLSITNLGWDDNVFRVGEEADPAGDFTATVSPSLVASIPWSRLQFTGAGKLDFNYFQRFAAIRSIDRDSRAAVAIALGRLRPHVGGSWTSARHRQNFEIDFPVRRVDRSWDAGVDIYVSAKTSIGLWYRRSRGGYTGETVYLGSDLASLLGDTATVRGVGVRYALTPLTTVGAEVERDNERLPLAPERNANGLRVTSLVEFRPLALVSGAARMGVRSRTFSDRSAPSFQGMVTNVDLSYTLLARTRFTVRSQRDLSYSYRPGERDYLQTGTEGMVTHRLGTAWDIGGSVGRFKLLYGLIERSPRAERVHYYGVDVGRTMLRSRVGFQVARQTRSSDFSAGRQYEEMRISSSVTYSF
jgi:Putative beta-barrel porin 2